MIPIKRRSTLGVLGLPESFGTLLATFALGLALAPYLAGADFGVIKVPTVPAGLAGVLRWAGPLALIAFLALFIPAWPEPRAPVQKRYGEDQRRVYSELWDQIHQMTGPESRNMAQVSYDDPSKGAAHHASLAEPGYQLIGTVDRLAPRLEPEHYEKIREYATAYCNYHVGRRMEYASMDPQDAGVWTPERGDAWKKLFFDDRAELEKIFREVLSAER